MKSPNQSTVNFDSFANPPQRYRTLYPLGNPQSPHAVGRAALLALESARVVFRNHFPFHQCEFIPGGGTMANERAIIGFLTHPKQLSNRSLRNRVLISGVEHKSVRGLISQLELFGYQAIIIPVERKGRIDMEFLEKWVCEGGVAMVSVMTVNNETGIIFDFPSIQHLIRLHDPEIIIHTDAAQGAWMYAHSTRTSKDIYCSSVDSFSPLHDSNSNGGPLPFSQTENYPPDACSDGFAAKFNCDGSPPPIPPAEHLLPDLITLCAYKFGGPHMGVVLAKTSACLVDKYFGTPDVPLIVNLTQSFVDFLPQHQLDAQLLPPRVFQLKLLIQDICNDAGVHVAFFGASHGSPYVLPLILNVDGGWMAARLDEKGFCVSRGSACSGSTHSPTLTAMGYAGFECQGFLRLSFSSHHQLTPNILKRFSHSLRHILHHLPHSARLYPDMVVASVVT